MGLLLLLVLLLIEFKIITSASHEAVELRRKAFADIHFVSGETLTDTQEGLYVYLQIKYDGRYEIGCTLSGDYFCLFQFIDCCD